MKYYEVNRSFDYQIKEIDVEKETNSCVYINGNRANKRGDYRAYFKTMEEAVSYSKAQLESKIERSKRQLQFDEGRLSKFLIDNQII